MLAVLLLAQWGGLGVDGQRAARRRPAVRERRGPRGGAAGAGRAPGRRRVPEPPRTPRPPPGRDDRVLRQQQGHRHRGVALGAATRAGGAGRGARAVRRRSHDLPRARRQCEPRRRQTRPRRFSAAPPGTVRGRLRVTEQGEAINANYGLRAIALRTLEQAVGAIALATALPAPAEPRAPRWQQRDGRDRRVEPCGLPRPRVR